MCLFLSHYFVDKKIQVNKMWINSTTVARTEQHQFASTNTVVEDEVKTD